LYFLLKESRLSNFWSRGNNSVPDTTEKFIIIHSDNVLKTHQDTLTREEWEEKKAALKEATAKMKQTTEDIPEQIVGQLEKRMPRSWK
jgi:hypothetical protein